MKRTIIKKICAVIFLCSVLFWLLVATGEKVEYYDNGVPTYFLEPENHVIVYVDVLSDNFLIDKYLYGYITNKDYQAYLDGTLKGVLVIKHPYEEGKSVSINVNMIESMEVGIYEDKRQGY